jgi:hypothetical protein
VLGFRCGPSHAATDKGVEYFAESVENGIELLPNVLFPKRGSKSGRGHGGFLTSPTGMMCRRRHRKARWLGVASHKRNIEMLGAGSRRSHALWSFMSAYERQREVASISYAVIGIFEPTARNMS